MNISAVETNEISIDDNHVSTPMSRSYSGIFQLNAALKKANQVHKKARQLYASSDADLGQLGITREDIPAHLAKEYTS